MIELRAAQFSDHIAIARLHAESWRLHYRGILADYYLDNEVEQDRLDTWYKHLRFPADNQRITVATNDNDIAGFSCLMLHDDPVFGSLIDNLHVQSLVKQSGIGRLLMKHCAKTIFDTAGNRQLYLWVFEQNRDARLFYERMGGTNVETVDKQHEDGATARVCRYAWPDAAVLLA